MLRFRADIIVSNAQNQKCQHRERQQESLGARTRHFVFDKSHGCRTIRNRLQKIYFDHRASTPLSANPTAIAISGTISRMYSGSKPRESTLIFLNGSKISTGISNCFARKSIKPASFDPPPETRIFSTATPPSSTVAR